MPNDTTKDKQPVLVIAGESFTKREIACCVLGVGIGMLLAALMMIAGAVHHVW